MTNRWILLILFLLNIFYQINSRESSLQCWRCEITAESSTEPGIFIDSMYYYLLIHRFVSMII
jgi:hypothetical protein